MSKEDCIKALNKQVNEIKSKNGDYARELSILSCTIDELTGRMVELERDVAAKKDALEEINEDVQEKQVIINTKVEENNTLSVELETLKSENDGLKATVDNLQSRNAAYAEEFENLLASLRELVDQNTKLENQVKELVDANKQLEELESRVRDLTGSLEESKVAYEAMKQVNEDANKQLEVLDSRVQDLTGSLEESKVANEAMKQVTKELRKEKVHFSDTVKKLEKVIDDTTAQMQAQLSSQKTKHDQEISVLERGLEMEIVSSGKVKKQCTETKKKYHNEVVKNEELKLKYEEMKSTHKKTLAGLTAELEERTTLLTKENTILLKQLEEESTATTQIATRQASLESELKSTKKSNKQEIAKLMNDLKAAESKAEALSKELTEEKDTTTKIAEMNAKLESKMKSNKKSDKKEAKEAAEKFQNALDIVQQQLAAEKEITAKLKGLQGRLEETEQHLLTAINSRTDLTEKLQEINGLNTDLKKDLAESKESQLHVLDRMNKLLERLDEKDDALSKITMEKSALFENLTATQGLNTQLTSEIKALTNELSKNDAEVNKFLNRLEENQRLLTVATAEKDQLQSMYGEYMYYRAPGSQSWQYRFSTNTN
jgi:chromosome segregation ATPase